MALPAIRPRGGYLFVAVLIGHILLISVQVTTRAGVPLLQAAVFGTLAEMQRAGAAMVDGAGSVWSGYVALWGVRAENAALRAQNDALRVQIQQQVSIAGESQRLHELLQLKDAARVTTLAADVVGGSVSPDFRTVTIGLGALDGIAADMAVIAPEGVVGRVVLTGPYVAKVQLLIDRNAAALVLVDRTRAQGIALGGQDGLLGLEFVSPTAELAEQDLVVTAGMDGIYPKGFVVGRVETVEKSGGAYRRITVRPAVDFTRLEHVLVVTGPKLASAVEQPR